MHCTWLFVSSHSLFTSTHSISHCLLQHTHYFITLIVYFNTHIVCFITLFTSTHSLFISTHSFSHCLCQHTHSLLHHIHCRAFTEQYQNFKMWTPSFLRWKTATVNSLSSPAQLAILTGAVCLWRPGWQRPWHTSIAHTQPDDYIGHIYYIHFIIISCAAGMEIAQVASLLPGRRRWKLTYLGICFTYLCVISVSYM